MAGHEAQSIEEETQSVEEETQPIEEKRHNPSKRNRIHWREETYNSFFIPLRVSGLLSQEGVLQSSKYESRRKQTQD